ncbi:VOC family protein [Demequina sp. SYSU T00192]|uniref:VOC family protein n=1 Tax=Demequina litoralis TaxID=3051660 RepID=A0ABT8GC05_9MICO|nr:VOC family protein [Demequina sp. SYSU T00192]MDN4476663.1 VOC family protein [Demequina sp. SYSU T00192]
MGTSEQDRIASGTRMGPVELRVDDLATMLAYYRDVLALEEIRVDGARHVLGRGGVETVVLTPTRGLPRFDRRGAGLFHTAVLFDSREGLAAAVLRVAQAAPGSFTGSADHLVSEAFYFDDPEGNGVELYFDRPRTSWARDAAGRPLMGTEHLDVNGFLRTHLTEAEATAPATAASVGHVHLQVGDIPTAKDFYIGALGFDEVLDMGSALFVSAGGYHHHVGLNTWNSRGAGPRAASLGLGTMDIVLPTADDLGAMRERLAHRGTAVADDGRTVAVRDPWGSEIRVTVAR